MPPTSTADALSRSARHPATLAQGIAEFLIRRRILISGVLFALLVANAVAHGSKPRSLADLGDPLAVAGLVLVLCGVALRSWAAGILHKNAQLATTGPYGLIRNPLYAGSFLMMFGFCALVADLPSVLAMLVPVVVIYTVKVRQEERLLSTRFPDQWASYARSTPRFLPRPRRVSLAADWRFSQWLQHREYQAILASLVALAAIQVWHVL